MYAPCCGKSVPHVVQIEGGMKDVLWDCPACKTRHKINATRMVDSSDGPNNRCQSRTLRFTRQVNAAS